MANNKQPNELVLVFEIENTQNSYACCLEAINDFENDVLNNGKSIEKFYSKLKHDNKCFYCFRVNQRSNGPNDKMENPINPGIYAWLPVPLDKEKQFLENAIEDWRKNKERLKRPLYHIRIKFDYDHVSGSYKNFDNMQFLAMFIQHIYFLCFDSGENMFSPNKLKERLSIFLVPYTGISHQFAGDDFNADPALFLLASQYLRLIAKMHNGVIFGNSPSGKVEAVNFKERTRNNITFPLLYLGKTELINNYQEIFDISGMPDKTMIEKGFTSKRNDSTPFNMAGDNNPLLAISDLILDETREQILSFFASLSKTKLNKEMSREDILNLGRTNISKYDFLKRITRAAATCDRFTFALFGYLLFAENNYSYEYIKNILEKTMELAQELGDGIRQIVQNSIQHSQYKMCYISLYKKKINNPSDGVNELLCVRVTDLNMQKTIIENFICALKKEELYGHFEKNNICMSISNMIGEFSSELPKDKNVLEAWYNFRKEDSAAHIGLTIFNNTLKRCQYNELQIISNINFLLQDKITFTNYNNYIGNNLVSNDLKYVIPGTQIYFSIPIKKLENRTPVNLVQLANNNAFSENHEAYAHYLDYKFLKESWPDKIASLYNLQITDAESKLNIQNEWKIFWCNLFESSIQQNIYYYNVIEIKQLFDFLKTKITVKFL